MIGRKIMVAPAVLLILLIAYLAGRAAWEGLTAIITAIWG